MQKNYKIIKTDFLQIIAGILAAIVGVRSAKNAKADFSSAKPIHYILVGIITVISLILLMYYLATLILH